MLRARLQSFVFKSLFSLKQTPPRLPINPRHKSTIRSLSFTSPCHATRNSNPNNGAFLAATAFFKETTTYKKLSENPGALLAVQKFAQVIQKQGVDTSKGMPSVFQMSKLAVNAEFQEASRNLMEEFNKAGIDFKDKVILDELVNLMKMLPKP